MPKRKLRVIASALPPGIAPAAQPPRARLLPASAASATVSMPQAARAHITSAQHSVAAGPQYVAVATSPQRGEPVVTLPQNGSPVAALPQNALSVTAVRAPATPANALVLRGAHWEVAFGEFRGIVEDCRGLRYIALLIRDAGADKGPVHAKELVALATGQDAAVIELDAADCVLDKVAKAQLVERITEIGLQRERASAADDYDTLAALDDEYDRIAEELSRCAAPRTGRGAFSHSGEKARKAVGKAITEAIARIASNPDLAPLSRHLATTIRKGQWLSYADSRDWRIELPLPRK